MILEPVLKFYNGQWKDTLEEVRGAGIVQGKGFVELKGFCVLLCAESEMLSVI